MNRMKKGLASLALAGSIIGTTVVGAGAAPVTQVTQNGARGLVAAVVSALNNVNVNDTNVDVAVVELNNSLNNLRALNNVLNNSPILSNNDILNNVTIGDISILSPTQIDILRNADINLDDVVAVAILNGGDIIVFR